MVIRDEVETVRVYGVRHHEQEHGRGECPGARLSGYTVLFIWFLE